MSMDWHDVRVLRALGFAACLAIAGGNSPSPEPPTRRAVIDLTIGQPDESRDDYIFSDVRGLAFDAKGRLWVREFDNKRFSVFSLGPTRATFLWSVRGVTNPIGSSTATTWDVAWRVIDIASTFNPATRAFGAVREIIDSAGKVVSIDTLAEPPSDSLAQKSVTKLGPDGTSIGTSTFNQPFGPMSLRAISPRGDLARGISSRYAISWEDIHGRRIALVARDGEGPPLSAKEKASADGILESISKNTRISRSALPFRIPERKPPVAAIGFDLDGRLWVRRSVVQGQPNVADVYDRTGKCVAIMEWPANVSLGMWTVAGTTGVAIARDSLDTPTIVRLRFH